MTLQEIRARYEAGEDPTQLMDEMERAYKIPAMVSDEYNQKHPEIIALYREISRARKL